jgi:hypothetical protein
MISIITAFDDQTDFVFNLIENSPHRSSIIVTWFFIENISGFLWALARLFEPYVLEEVKKLLTKSKKKEKGKYE